MKTSEIVKESVSEWEYTPSQALEEIERIVTGIDSAIQELDNVGVDFSDLEDLKEAWNNRKSWYEND